MLHKDANPYSRGRTASRRRDRARAPAGGDGRRHHARRSERAGQGPRGRLRRRGPRPRPARVARRRGLPAALHRRARDQGPHAHGRRLDRRPRRRPGARRRRLPAQAVPLARARRADPRARAPRRPRPAADPPPRRSRARPRPPRGAPRRGVARPHAEGVRRPRGAARGQRPGGLDGGAARARLGRARRPVHEHGADVRHDAAAQARRSAGDQDGDRRRLPGLMRRPRPTVRLRMTLLYAGVFFMASALLLSVSYALVRNNLTNPGNLRNLPADNWDYNVTAQHEIATDALSHLRTQYAIALAAITGLSVLLGWAVAGRVLRPLQRITATAKRVSQDNLDERIGLEGPPDELKELADTFDGMLERLSGAFASQRRFVANASHELRTPLTVIRTELEVTLADPNATTGELRTMAETVRDATLATERLIQALLTLARSQGGVQRRDDVDLADAARLALGQTGADAAARHIDMRPTLDPAPVRGDRRLLERLVANLVENAVRHNPAGGSVEVHTARAAGLSTVEVRNDGDVIPSDALASLLEPFQRLDRGARGDGVGLGLSIVRSVAEAHGGSVELRARPSGGLVVRVALPGREGAIPDTDFTQGDYADDRARAHA